MAARLPLSPPRPAQREAAARSMPSATRVAPRTRSSRRRIAARDSQRRARDEVLGQRPVAYVIPAASAGGPDLADALREACEAELPRPKVPTEFCLVPELPLGATGKVSRRRLRELAMAAG